MQRLDDTEGNIPEDAAWDSGAAIKAEVTARIAARAADKNLFLFDNDNIPVIFYSPICAFFPYFKSEMKPPFIKAGGHLSLVIECSALRDLGDNYWRNIFSACFFLQLYNIAKFFRYHSLKSILIHQMKILFHLSFIPFLANFHQTLRKIIEISMILWTTLILKSTNFYGIRKLRE